MADLPPSDTERLTQLETQLATAIGRIEALEVKLAMREAGITDSQYLQTEIFGAVAGSKEAASLNRFQ